MMLMQQLQMRIQDCGKGKKQTHTQTHTSAPTHTHDACARTLLMVIENYPQFIFPSVHPPLPDALCSSVDTEYQDKSAFNSASTVSIIIYRLSKQTAKRALVLPYRTRSYNMTAGLRSGYFHTGTGPSLAGTDMIIC